VSGGGLHGETSAIKLVEYSNNAVVVWNNQDRMTLDSQTYALQFFPVRHYDHGEYTCLVNERRRPDTIIHLVVQGKKQQQQICLFLFGRLLVDVYHFTLRTKR
jgi:receptor-type tyrosine-protein phosphatase gamma